MNQWFREPGDAEPLVFGNDFRTLEAKRRHRELIGTVILGTMTTIVVFLAGMIVTNRDAIPRYYPSSSSANFVGAAPISRGSSGYRPALDPDNDGIACEPYQRD